MSHKWIHATDPESGFFDELNQALEQFEKAYPMAFPDLRGEQSIYVVSDYGGEHKSARFEAQSFLFATSSTASNWIAKRQQIRDLYLRDGRTMSYKGLGDQRKRDALIPFLAAADSIDGLLLVVLIDKNVRSIFSRNERQLSKLPELKSLSNWTPKILEKALRAVNIVGCALNGLGAVGQSIAWISDQDNESSEKRATGRVKTRDFFASKVK